MRILHVTDRLSARGGADWHLLCVLRQLSATHELLLAVGRDDGSAAAPCTTETVRHLDDPRRPFEEPVLRSEPSGLARSLDRLVESFQPAVIHVHNAVSPAALSWAADRGAVMTVQDHRSFCPGQGKLTLSGEVCDTLMSHQACAPCFADERYFERIYALTAERFTSVARMGALTVLSRYMKQQLEQLGAQPPLGIHVLRPLITGSAEAGEPAEPDCVLFAGRLVRAKGVWDAVEGWQRSKVGIPLVFAGTGPERAALEQRGFEVLGWVPHQRMAAVYRRARVLLLPSRWQEPFGIVGPEALSAGVPVVSWRSGGIAEWHPGEAGGALVDWGDVGALGAALSRYGTRSRSLRSPRLPAGFDTALLMQQLEQIYRAVAVNGAG